MRRSAVGCGAWAVASLATAVQGVLWMVVPAVLFLLLGAVCVFLPHESLARLTERIEDKIEEKLEETT